MKCLLFVDKGNVFKRKNVLFKIEGLMCVACFYMKHTHEISNLIAQGFHKYHKYEYISKNLNIPNFYQGLIEDDL